MRPLRLLCSGLLVLVAFSACEKKDASSPRTNPTIVFRNDPGYTFRDDTVGQMDTVRVGVIINRGTDGLHSFKVERRFDQGPVQVTDSLPLGIDSFEFDKLIITRAQPGKERWSFVVVENDGDMIRRSITFTVQ
jgi:hypothetical protein